MRVMNVTFNNAELSVANGTTKDGFISVPIRDITTGVSGTQVLSGNHCRIDNQSGIDVLVAIIANADEWSAFQNSQSTFGTIFANKSPTEPIPLPGNVYKVNCMKAASGDTASGVVRVDIYPCIQETKSFI